MSYTVRPATRADAGVLANTMRAEDRAEVLALGLTPEEAVSVALTRSEVPYAGLVGGQLVCMFGIGRPALTSFIGWPWMLSTEALPLHWRGFLRGSREVVREAQNRYDMLTNIVDARHDTAIRWISWLGFDLYPAEPIGPYNQLFHRFEWRKV